MLGDSCVTGKCVHGAWDDAVSGHHCHFGKPQGIGALLYFFIQCDTEKKIKEKIYMELKIEQLKQGEGL